MPGLPEGSMQFEDDLAQIRNDIGRIQDDMSWMSQFGPVFINVMNELRTIRRLLEMQMGETTREEVQKQVEEDTKELRAFENENAKRMRMRRG